MSVGSETPWLDQAVAVLEGHGVPRGRLRVDEAAQRELDGAGTRGLMSSGEVLVDPEQILSDVDARELVAHEAVHVEQAKIPAGDHALAGPVAEWEAAELAERHARTGQVGEPRFGLPRDHVAAEAGADEAVSPQALLSSEIDVDRERVLAEFGSEIDAAIALLQDERAFREWAESRGEGDDEAEQAASPDECVEETASEPADAGGPPDVPPPDEPGESVPDEVYLEELAATLAFAELVHLSGATRNIDGSGLESALPETMSVRVAEAGSPTLEEVVEAAQREGEGAPTCAADALGLAGGMPTTGSMFVSELPELGESPVEPIAEAPKVELEAPVCEVPPRTPNPVAQELPVGAVLDPPGAAVVDDALALGDAHTQRSEQSAITVREVLSLVGTSAIFDSMLLRQVDARLARSMGMRIAPAAAKAPVVGSVIQLGFAATDPWANFVDPFLEMFEDFGEVGQALADSWAAVWELDAGDTTVGLVQAAASACGAQKNLALGLSAICGTLAALLVVVAFGLGLTGAGAGASPVLLGIAKPLGELGVALGLVALGLSVVETALQAVATYFVPADKLEEQKARLVEASASLGALGADQAVTRIGGAVRKGVEGDQTAAQKAKDAEALRSERDAALDEARGDKEALSAVLHEQIYERSGKAKERLAEWEGRAPREPETPGRGEGPDAPPVDHDASGPPPTWDRVKTHIADAWAAVNQVPSDLAKKSAEVLGATRVLADGHDFTSGNDTRRITDQIAEAVTRADSEFAAAGERLANATQQLRAANGEVDKYRQGDWRSLLRFLNPWFYAAKLDVYKLRREVRAREAEVLAAKRDVDEALGVMRRMLDLASNDVAERDTTTVAIKKVIGFAQNLYDRAAAFAEDLGVLAETAQDLGTCMDSVEEAARSAQAEPVDHPVCEENGPTDEELSAFEEDLCFIAVDAPESLRPFTEQPNLDMNGVEQAWIEAVDHYIEGAVDQALAWREGEMEAAVTTIAENDPAVETADWIEQVCAEELTGLEARSAGLDDATSTLSAARVPEVPAGLAEQLAKAREQVATHGDRALGAPGGLDQGDPPNLETIAEAHGQALARAQADQEALSEYRMTLLDTQSQASGELESLREEVAASRAEHEAAASTAYAASDASAGVATTNISALERWAVEAGVCPP